MEPIFSSGSRVSFCSLLWRLFCPLPAVSPPSSKPWKEFSQNVIITPTLAFFSPVFSSPCNNAPPYMPAQHGHDVTTCPCVRPLPKHPQKGGGGRILVFIVYSLIRMIFLLVFLCSVLSSPGHCTLHWRCIFQHGADLFRFKSLNLNVSTHPHCFAR